MLLYVGRIEPLKGLELLLYTAAQLQTCEQIKGVSSWEEAQAGTKR